jgi:hypothetical protein
VAASGSRPSVAAVPPWQNPHSSVSSFLEVWARIGHRSPRGSGGLVAVVNARARWHPGSVIAKETTVYDPPVPCECGPPGLNVIGYVAGVGFLGSIVGYVVAVLVNYAAERPRVDDLRWTQIGAVWAGWGAGFLFAFDWLL